MAACHTGHVTLISVIVYFIRTDYSTFMAGNASNIQPANTPCYTNRKNKIS